MKTLTLLAMTSAALTVAAQTPSTTHTPAVHHTAPAHATAPAGGCVTAPAISPKIPAAGTLCTKALYTISRTPETHLDYISPLVSPELREALDIKKETFSLLYSDEKPGTGELVRPGTFLSVKYTGWLTDGSKFDSSYDHEGGKPLTFQHGMHRVIPGWDTGFEGMHVGGKRRLYIPYQLAYGEAGHPPVIPAHSMLVFDIELVAQSDTAPEPPAAEPAPQRLNGPIGKPATPPSAPASEPAKPATPPAGTATPPPSSRQ
jgi:peptidylprolyl isomerase